MSRDIFHQPRLLRAPSNLALNPAREGTATASLGNPSQCLTTLMGKNFFLIPYLNLPSFSLPQGPARSSSGSPADAVLLLSRDTGPYKAPRLSLCAAQRLGNLRSLLQLPSSPGAWKPPLVRCIAFTPSEPHLLWLKVDGMGPISQERDRSSASIRPQFSPSSGCNWRSP